MNSYHNLIPTFTPIQVRAIDTFSNEDATIATIDALSDWVYEEASHYISYANNQEFKRTFIDEYNKFAASDWDKHEFVYIDTTYYLIKD